MKKVSVLFVRSDSVYFSLGVDAWDAARDALNYSGVNPLVVHPPCRSWGRLRKLAKPRPGEKELAPWSVDQIRKFGGVLEHPQASSLWKYCGLPRPGLGVDSYGGFTLDVDQHWWGHKAQKRTWLYVCGCSPRDVPAMPITLTRPTHVIASIKGLKSGMYGFRSTVKIWEREATPIKFAEWLIELASKCSSSF